MTNYSMEICLHIKNAKHKTKVVKLLKKLAYIFISNAFYYGLIYNIKGETFLIAFFAENYRSSKK